jgi:iron-sulfur cluster repair protein YtfE (RIC family)
MSDGTGALTLATRTGLPEALRVLLAERPRAEWEADPAFGGLVRFWLDRHLMFRRLIAQLREDAEGAAAGALSPADHAARLARLGGILIGELEGHHRIEDAHYFPALAQLEPRIARGFKLLEADHQALDGHLAGLDAAAKRVLAATASAAAARGAAGRFLPELATFDRLLDRHLTDEEDLVVPVILRHGERGLA